MKHWQRVAVGPKLRRHLDWQKNEGTDRLTPEESEQFDQELADFIATQPCDSLDDFLDIAEELVLMRLPTAAQAWFATHSHLPWQTNPRALLNQGSAALLAKDFSLAEDLLRKCQALAPDEPATYANLAQVYYQQHRDPECQTWCEAGLRVDANHRVIWEHLGAVLRQSQSAEATGEALLKRARQLHSWAGVSIASQYIAPEDALYRAQLLEDLFNQGTRDYQFLIELTAALGLANQYEKIPSIAWQAEKMNSDPLPWQVLVHAGQAEMAMENPDKAKPWLQSAQRCTDLPAEVAIQIEEMMEEDNSL